MLPPWVIISAAFVKTGGQDRANFALAAYMAGRGVPVHLVAHRVGGQLSEAGAIHHRAPRPLGSDLLGEPFLQYLGPRTARALHGQSPYVVANGGNCTWPGVNWVHYVHAAWARPPVGGLLRGMRVRAAHRYWLTGERRALLAARLVIANSHRTRRDLVERVGVPAERIKVIYYGIDPEQFRPPCPGEREDTRAALGWPLDRPVVLFVGALGDQRKGFDTAFDAWTTLARRRSLDPLLVVIGQGALLAPWQHRVTSAGLDRSIHFMGFRDDVPQLMRAADGLVSPTRYEAYGLGVHEALCCGLPAIVSADAGVAEQYPDELSGWLLPDSADASDLAERVNACLSGSSRQRQAIDASASRLRSRTWDHMAAEIAAAVAQP